METSLTPPDTQRESLRLGIALTAIQVVVYFAFILCCSYAQTLLAREFMSTGVPVSFVFGLAVIACGVLLTVIYVHVTNKQESGQ